MSLSAHRWHVISESQFPWERDALQFLREGLPDQEPYQAWSNFEFISTDGRIYEVDVLVLTPKGLFFIEIKSRPGELKAGAHTWVWREGVSQYETDNPLILANRKAKRLAGILSRQNAFARGRAPFIEALIFASVPGLRMQLDPPLRAGVFGRDRLNAAGERVGPGILAALMDRGVGPPGEPLGRIDAIAARTVARALEQAGIRPSNRVHRVSDYELGRLLFEGPGYQDYEARHVSLGTRRRVRLYPIPLGAPAELRIAIGRAPAREFQILEGIRQAGILHADDYRETERGPALIFAHDPAALRLDHFLTRHASRLDAGQRLALLRQIAEALQYAHGRRLIHRALSPQSILVSAPDSPAPTIQIFNWQTGAREGTTTSGLPTVLRPTTHLEQLVEDTSLVFLSPETFTREAPPGPVQDVVAFHDEVEICGLTALVMDRAGETTLAERLRNEGKLQVELLERFGEDLLSTIDYLDQEGISHRDIKPQNIGVTPLGRGDRLHLVLFDFTLSRTPPENIRAGTVPYLDPFTGKLPQWGDGLSDPAMLDCEVTIESDLFDPALRDALTAFFGKALARDASARFDNAGDMLRAWRDAFARADLREAPGEEGARAGDLDRGVAQATLDMPLAELALSSRRGPGIELTSISSAITRYATRMPAAPVPPAEVAEARQFEDRLRYAAEHGQFLVLGVSPRDLSLAERELSQRFPVDARSVEQLLIEAMKQTASEVGADWMVVRRADAAPEDSREWRNVQALVRRAVPKVEGALGGAARTQLLLYPGLLARYGQLGLLGMLRDRLGRPGGPHGVWVLVPADDQEALPTIDGHAIPVITPGEWARIPSRG